MRIGTCGAGRRCSRFRSRWRPFATLSHSLSVRSSNRRVSISRSCCAASTSRVERRRARRSIALLGSIGRGFGVAAESVAATGGRGKAYFVERLLKDVLIGESGLAGVNKRVEMRKAAAQLGAYAAMALIAVLGIVALTVSYGRNRTYLADAGADVARLQAVPPIRQGASVQTLLPRLDAVRAVVDSANRYQDAVPWSMRWGLYQGNSIGNSARDAYVRELDGSLLPFVAARFRQRLVQYGAEPEKLYEYLKAYLMLGQPEHLDKKHLQYLADLEWSTANGVSRRTRQVAVEAFSGPARSRRRPSPDRPRLRSCGAGRSVHPAGVGSAASCMRG